VIAPTRAKGVAHVGRCGLPVPATDRAIWEWAGGWTVATNDEDFQELSALYGPPPKVVLLRTGNQSTSYLAQLIGEMREEIARFVQTDGLGVLELY
jgi:predicted nuclease of predicted toxin-antitoxin system